MSNRQTLYDWFSEKDELYLEKNKEGIKPGIVCRI